MKKENCFFGILDIHKVFELRNNKFIKVSEKMAQSLNGGNEFPVSEAEIVQVDNV
jgi:hypothetical protein